MQADSDGTLTIPSTATVLGSVIVTELSYTQTSTTQRSG